MSSHLRQTNFTAGELSPFLYGRTDIDLFSRGLRTLKNFIVDRHGMAHSRPGMEYLGKTRNSDAAPIFSAFGDDLSSQVRLLPFVYSDSISYLLEVTPGYIRVWGYDNGVFGRISWYEGVDEIDELVTTLERPLYAAEDLPLLQWSQVGDKMTITCPSRPAYIFQRAFNTGVGAPIGSLTFSIEEIDYSLKQIRWVEDIGAASQKIGGYAMLVSSGTASNTNIFIGDDTHPLREWRWKVTATLKNGSTGKIFESRAFEISESYDGINGVTRSSTGLGASGACKVRLYADLPVTIKHAINVFPGDSIPSTEEDGFVFGDQYPRDTSYSVVEYNYYRGRGSLFGYVGSSKTLEFVDVGVEPDYSTPPPLGSLPVNTSCSANTIFENRRVLAGFEEEPGSINLSASNQYENFDRIPKQPSAISSLLYDLNSRKRERIRTLVALSRLYVFTDSSVWSFSGSGGSPLSAEVVPDARVIDEVGSTTLMPIVVNHSILFARSKGRGVRALVPTTTTQEGGLAPQDISTHSEHLFRGGETPTSFEYWTESTPIKRIVDWTYAEDPYGIVWVVRADNTLLSLTYGQGVAAWARHETDGRVLSVCALPEEDEDVVYMAVRRNSGGVFTSHLSGSITTIERFSSRVRNDNIIKDDRCLDCSISQLVTLPVIAPGDPYPQTLTITGLQHLAGNEVWATSFGNPPYGPLTVSAAGEITLPEFPAGNYGADNAQLAITVGLLYTCDLETLDAIPREGRFQVKNVKSVGVEVSGSRGLQVGETFDNMVDWPQRSVDDGFNPPAISSEIVRIPIEATWNTGARGCIRQSLPLPVTVLGITREYMGGGE